MKWIFILVAVGLVGPSSVLGQVDHDLVQFTKTQPRAWADSSGKHQMQGKLVARNMATSTIKLERADQSTVEVELAKLRNSDRNYVARQTSKLQRAKAKANETASGQDLLVETNPQKRPADSAETRRLSGIDWHTEPIQAAQAATGSETVSDDRPIIWFRVLGELEGYM